MYGAGRAIPAEEACARIAAIGIVPDPDYVEFIGRWGGCFVGVPVHAWDHSSLLGIETCLELTAWAREDCGEVIDGLVFAQDGSGNPMWIAGDGTVRIADHDNGDTRTIARSFRDLIRENVHGG